MDFGTIGIIIGLLLVLLLFYLLYFLHESRWIRIQEPYLFTEKTFWGVKVKSHYVSINEKSMHLPVKIMVSRNGMYMKPYYPQRIFSKAVLIPWDEFNYSIDYKKHLKHYKQLNFKNTHHTIEVSVRDFYKIIKYINRKDETT